MKSSRTLILALFIFSMTGSNYAVGQLRTFTIVATTGSNGTLTPNGSVVVDSGSDQLFTGTPNTGYHLDSVFVDGTNVGPVVSYPFINVSANHTIRTVYAIDKFMIKATVGAFGSISPSGSVVVDYGTNRTFTITPVVGNHVDSVIVDGVNQGPLTSYTFNAVSSNHTIRGAFAPNVYSLTMSSGPNGNVIPGGVTLVAYGSSRAFSITPSTGYHVDSVFVDGNDQGRIASYTFVAVTKNHTLRAVFAINHYSIASSSGPNGTISPAGSTVISYGVNQTFTFSSATGYHVDSVIVDGANQGQSASYTFAAVSANHTIRIVHALNHYTITASAGSNGSITPGGSVDIAYGSNQSFTVAPMMGYHIDSVLVDGASVGPLGTYTFTNVTANHAIRTVYASDQHTITAIPGPNGSLIPNGPILVNHGADQSFTMTPGAGYHIDSVLVDGVDVGPGGAFTFTNVTANHTIRTVYAINQYTITATTGSSGSLIPNGTVSVSYGSNQSFTITADAQYHIDSVLVDGVDVGPLGAYTFSNVTANHTIRTVYAINQYTITATTGSGGSLIPNGTVSVSYGSNQNFTITADAQYHIDSVLVDGVDVGRLGAYTFSNVTANHTIRTVYAINQYTITATTGPNGSISPTGLVAVNYGSTQSYTATPASGYHIDSLFVDGANQGALSSYTFSAIAANHTIRVVFDINRYTITASTGPNGSLSPLGGVLVNYGASQAFAVAPATGYHVDSVLVDGVNQGNISSYTFTNVTGDHTIRTVFDINVYTIEASTGLHGSIAPLGTTIVPYGGSQSYTMTPSVGYHVSNVTVDGSSVGRLSSFTFSGVQANHVIAVLFGIDTLTITATAGPYGSISPSGTVAVHYGAGMAFAIVPDSAHRVDSVFVDDWYVGAGTTYSFTNVTSNHTILAKFGIGSCYRSFVYDSMHVRRGLKKKPVSCVWEFRIVNSLKSPVGEVNVRFRNDVMEILSSGAAVPTGKRKDWVFAGTLKPNQTLTIRGRSAVPPARQMISRYWLGPISGSPARDLSPSSCSLELPMPNFADVRDELFARGAFASTKGLVIGVPRSDSANWYGWARIPKSTDMFHSIQDQSGYHNGVPRGFDRFNSSGRAFVGEQNRVPPHKHNNRLFADLLALKFNIALSAMRITPPGFGELRYLEPGSPYNNFLVREIAARADSVMTMWRTRAGWCAKLDSTIARINASFSGAIDTTCWTDSLRLSGVRDLGAVTFMEPSGVVPSFIAPVASSVGAELPVVAELYQNYPNPFNPTTTIDFDLAEPSIVVLKVYNIVGQEVATLINGESLDDGFQQAEFDASKLASGVYFYRLVANSIDVEGSAVHQFTQIRKMILVK